MLIANITRFFYVFVVSSSCSLTEANWFEANVFGRKSYGGRLHKRQLEPIVARIPVTTNIQLGTGVNVAPETSTAVSSSSTAAPAPEPTTSTPTQQPQTTGPAESTQTSPPPNTSNVNTDPNLPSSTQGTSTSTGGGKSGTTVTVKPSASVTQSVELITSVVTLSGSVFTSISSSTAEVPNTEATGNPSSQTSGNNSSGVSSKTRNTIIGVVVGIGGAALLAGLFLVAWRIWGRKKDQDEDHGLMNFRTSSPGQEKTGGIANARPTNPFQSTLETYHNPTKVNASSNF